jgi:hypothetical protein
MLMDYPRITWKPDIDVGVGAIASKIAFFTGNQKPFVVYKNGTCIFPSIVDENCDEHCNEFLKAVVFQRPDFEVSKMEDGSYLVSFAGPVYALVLNDEYEKNRDYIVASINQGGLLPGEKILSGNSKDAPVDHYYIGLFARARLYADVAESCIVQSINM